MNQDSAQTPSPQGPAFKSLTPVLVVDAIEPCLPFWLERLAFKEGHRVPGPDGKLIFASIQRDGVEIMYQTQASVQADLPEAGFDHGRSTFLFVQVADLDSVEKALAGIPAVKPRHDTFYGSTELYVQEPGGNIVGFAQMH